jgi:hypothetical protein
MTVPTCPVPANSSITRSVKLITYMSLTRVHLLCVYIRIQLD